jgi:TRAP-type C4-dicarboxylate transport system permease small subunit
LTHTKRANRQALNTIGKKQPAFIRALGVIVDWSTIVIGGIIIGLVFTNVVLHMVDRDLAWTTELSELLMVWVTFIGGAAAARRGEHVAITELLDIVGGRARQCADAIVQVSVAVILLLLIWYGISISESAWKDQLTVLEWPMSVEYVALPIGSAATLVFVLYDLLQIVRGLPRTERYIVSD